MSREQKLGLIAGFTVVLLFGVLLADHLSRARAEPLLVSDPVDEPLVIPPIDVPTRVGAASVPAETRFAVSDDDRGGMEREVPEGGAAVREPVVIDPGSDRVAAGSVPPSVRSIFERVSSPQGPVPGVELEGFEPVGRSGGSVDAGAASTASRARTHEVQRGETLYQIAERYYGNGHLWRELMSHNRGRVGADGGVVIGAVLTIPPRGLVAGSAGGSGRAAAVAAAAEPGEERTYTVKSGDTLSEISQKLLGTTKRMEELITLNRDQIRDADDIRVGMKLRYRPGPSA